jgi:hypothetical protein
VTLTTISSLVPTLQLFSNQTLSPSSQQEKDAVPLAAATEAPKESTPVPADTVNLSAQSKPALTEIRKNEAPKNEIANKINKTEQPESAVGKIQYVYDLNGKAKVQYLDVSGRLVYQVPSKLALQLKEYAPKTEPSLNAKA